eukprot:2425662-Prymnesium_polylepis.1
MHKSQNPAREAPSAFPPRSRTELPKPSCGCRHCRRRFVRVHTTFRFGASVFTGAIDGVVVWVARRA